MEFFRFYLNWLSIFLNTPFPPTISLMKMRKQSRSDIHFFNSINTFKGFNANSCIGDCIVAWLYPMNSRASL